VDHRPHGHMHAHAPLEKQLTERSKINLCCPNNNPQSRMHVGTYVDISYTPPHTHTTHHTPPPPTTALRTRCAHPCPARGCPQAHSTFSPGAHQEESGSHKSQEPVQEPPDPDNVADVGVIVISRLSALGCGDARPARGLSGLGLGGRGDAPRAVLRSWLLFVQCCS
jgi:hypothetical protein